MPTLHRWDIVCRVVDNFGDAGVCLRLARQLAGEHGIAPTLWIDDVASLARIVPGLDTHSDDQTIDGVRVRPLAALAGDPLALPAVVVEGFGCGLPDAFVAAMAAAARPPLWIVLEYLSAEPWIDASHALPSRHPQLPLTRWFWFPGFTAKTGGLLREAHLFEQRDAFQRNAGARNAMWADLRIAPQAGALVVSLFCYTNPALPTLFDAWADGDEPVVCIVPEGVAHSELDLWTGGAMPHAGAPLVRGRLTVVVVPFVDQEAFDRRLWSSDLNFVRGEDSFVRAQWAARPFAWHVYPQDADAHLAKMDAFLVRLEAHMDDTARAAQRAFWFAWNTADPQGLADAWPPYRAALASIAAKTRTWASDLAEQADLAGGLVSFSESKL